MKYENEINTLESVVKNSLLPLTVQESLIEQLSRIKRRISDDKLYLGLVGEFSSGKSTFINSLIGENFFRSDPLQGTTTTITKLEYGNRVNLKIVLSSGKTLKYNNDKFKILNQYYPEKIDSLSTLQKLKMRVLDFLHLNKADEYLLDVFDRITTSNEISQTLEDVTIYYPSDILKGGIVVVDTPGTDSLIPSHGETTLRAIRDVCDIALVITTASQVMPQTLVKYLMDNLGEVADKCVYIITKIELIRKSIERTHILKAAFQRIQNFLDVENPQVILAPSLLSLEERGIVERTGPTNQLSEEDRRSLCSNYKSDISQILAKIQDEKELTIKHKIKRLTLSLRENIQSEIAVKENELKNELAETHMMRVKPLRDFMQDFFSKNTVFQYSYLEARIANTILSYKSSFKKFVFDRIDSSTTKNETQSTMEDSSTISTGYDTFSHCYDDFKSALMDIQASYIDNFDKFKTSFFNMFSIESVDFEYSIINNPNWQKKYDFNYNKSNLTTFPLFRMFKSLESVKTQMKNDVGPKIDAAFETMEKHYLDCAKKSYADLEKQMEKVKSVFVQKYEKVIEKRIKESYKQEKSINDKMELLKTNLMIINNMDN